MSFDDNNTGIDSILKSAKVAFSYYKETNPESKALFLESIAFEIEALGSRLIKLASEETNLQADRLESERARTTNQLRGFAGMLREGSWAGLSIDTSDVHNKPMPKKDIRKMLIAIGPVVVFGASNFPFAYSTAGGDTASALAAGCPVIVKAHAAHAATSAMVAQAIEDAIVKSKMPANVFQHVTDTSFKAGKMLVEHPDTAAVGFTGSFAGGKALYDYAQKRKVPIPVFAEMGSVNPVLLLPDALATNAISIAQLYVPSITNGMGQFCTKPGVLIGLDNEGMHTFVTRLKTELAYVLPAKMLHLGIQSSYKHKLDALLKQRGVDLVQHNVTNPEGEAGRPTIAEVSGADFIANKILHEEIFGPFALVVRCASVEEMLHAWALLKGQLTTSIMATENDFATIKGIRSMAEDMAGRIVLNDIPTGVQVCPSMVHGGPFPASTDSRFTAVGINAVKRWVRPVCYQNFPDHLLPIALRNANPQRAWRLVNNEWTNNAL